VPVPEEDASHTPASGRARHAHRDELVSWRQNPKVSKPDCLVRSGLSQLRNAV
jgi:hypothetical protein